MLVIVLSGCGRGPMPYDATTVREDASTADQSITAIAANLMLDGIAPVASQRVDFCVDQQSRAPFQGEAPSYSCYVADLRVFELAPDVAGAAAVVDLFLLEHDFDADPYVDRAETRRLVEGETGVVRQQLGIDPRRELISTLAVGPSSVFFAWSPPGADSDVLSTSGDALYSEQTSEEQVIDCECVQWWLIVVENYATALRP